MPDQTRIVHPSFKPRVVRTPEGEMLYPPDDWDLLPPGDAAVTRKVKKAGPSWTVQYKKGRKTMSRGVWAPKENIQRAKEEVSQTREDPAYQRKLAQSRRRRDKKEAEYVADFKDSVLEFLAFDASFSEVADKLAEAVSAHATPVGSGTVARTKRIPVEERAQAAVIAWMRHQTSAYDRMSVPRVKGARREVRQQIARHSRDLLQKYRRGTTEDLSTCPLYKALYPNP